MKRLLVAMLVAVLVLGVAHAEGWARVKTNKNLAPGLKLLVIRWRGADYHVLKVTQLHHRVVKALPASGSSFLPAKERPSATASRAGALGAVGAGFMDPQWEGEGGSHELWTAYPTQALVIDREVWSTGIQGNGWGLQMAGSSGRVGFNSFTFGILPDWEARHDKDGSKAQPIRVMEVNARRPLGGSDVVAFTARDHYPPHYPLRGCTAVLVPLSRMRWSQGKVTDTREYRVKRQAGACKGAQQPTKGQLVLNAQAGTQGATLVHSLDPGDRVTWKQNLGSPGVKQVIAGWPQFVQDRRFGDDAGQYMHGSISHVALGVSRDGHAVYLVDVDNNATSDGATYQRLGRFMIRFLGVWDAVGLDGGGSKVMWVTKPGPWCHGGRAGKGCLLSAPGYGTERLTMYASAVL